MLGEEQHLYYREESMQLMGSTRFDESKVYLPEQPIRKEKKWLCAGCYDPILEVTGVIPVCLRCYMLLKPNEYRLQLCPTCNQTAAGVEIRARYNHLRKKHQS
ncbi:hypothetical protein AN401_02640 [Zobellella denitrificans]|uniref:Uncharacterized protein n=1 Tax=Zobellella denitrificans TaxID=347534 RepID=A0A291HL20_9GAMM|nr:hypothetical protein AN401_02640 [Zobellella denitrificans]